MKMSQDLLDILYLKIKKSCDTNEPIQKKYIKYTFRKLEDTKIERKKRKIISPLERETVKTK